MKVALITVVHEIWIEEECGIASLGGYLRSVGIDVKLFEEKYADKDILVNRVKEYNPDVIGFTIYDDTLDIIEHTLYELKVTLNHCHYVIGGIAATNNYEKLLRKWRFIDCVFLGEGELSFYNYLLTLEKHDDLNCVAGIAYIMHNDIVVNPLTDCLDMNRLPFMAHDILEEKKEKVATICTSRGCKRGCSFCSSPKIWGGWRGKKAQLVVDEIEYIYNKHEVTYFNLNDNSIEDPDGKYNRALEIADEIIKRKLDICYKANTRIESINELSLDKLDRLKKSGLCILFVGVEASNEYDLELYNKKITVKQIEEALMYLKKNNMPFFIGYINFNPFSTIERLEKNIVWLYKNNLAFCVKRLFSQYFCYKEHALYKKLKEKDMLYGDKGPFFYKFTDKRVEMLITASNLAIKCLRECSKYFKLFELLTREWAIYDVANLERHIVNSKDKKLIECLEKNKREIDDILMEIGKYNYTWFYQLLTSAKLKDCKIEELFLFVLDALDDCKLKKYVLMLQNIKLKFYTELMKNNKNLKRYLK